MSQAVRRALKLTKATRGCTRSVLAVLAAHMNDEGLAWPSLRTLARETGWSRRAVVRELAVLEQLGEVTRFVRGHDPDEARRHTGRVPRGGWQRTNAYHLTILHPSVQVVTVRHHPGGDRQARQVVTLTTAASLFPEVPDQKKNQGAAEGGAGMVSLLKKVREATNPVSREDLRQRLVRWCRQQGLTPAQYAEAVDVVLDEGQLPQARSAK